MSLEISVKSIVVEESTSDVVSDYILIGVCGVDACMITICLVRSKLQLSIEAFGIGWESSHRARSSNAKSNAG